MGISGLIEGEEGESIASPSFGDRLDYNIPKNQVDFLKKIRKGSDKPIVAIITGGSPMNLSEIHDIADAVLLVWYPGEEGGNAIADIIFGKISPSGKLPVTFPKSLDQLPPYEDYSMKGRTYRYMEAEPMYPFGFGLSYTTFKYSDLFIPKTTINKTESTNAEVTVTNSGKFESEEVVQLYVTHLNLSSIAPFYALKGFKRVKLKPGEVAKVKFDITPELLSLVNDKGESFVEPGKVKLSIGGSLPTQRNLDLGAPKGVETTLIIQ
jgi:beta-glucosidase